MKIYHNPRCRKSREVLKLLQERGIDPVVIEYLKTPFDFKYLSNHKTHVELFLEFNG